MITGTLTNATTYYYGPGTSKYLSGGMLAPGTQVEVLWREQVVRKLKFYGESRMKAHGIMCPLELRDVVMCQGTV